MRTCAVIMFAVSVICCTAVAEVNVTGSVSVQAAKKSGDNTTANVDESFVRGEVKVSGKLESGLNGIVHFRTEPKLASGVKKIDLQPRQIYFKVPVSIVELMAGRWYETYGAGNNFFGQYLYGVGIDKNTKKVIGNGSMNTDYKVLDGMKAALNLKTLKSSLDIGVLPADSTFETASLMAKFGGCPVERLKYAVAGNFQAITPKDSDPVHRAMVNCSYTLVKEMRCSVFGEAAVVDMEDFAENVWFLAGFSTSVPLVLDRFQAEFEIKNHRNGDPDAINNLRWMVMMRKKVMDLTFDLNVGADPATLGSQRPGEIGAIFRATASF